MRLIDADWALAHIKPYESTDERWSVTGGTAICLIHNAIDNAPTADAAPVVRCKDCKHAESYLRPDGKTGVYCRCPVSIFDYANGYVFTPSRNVDDFCSYGERRDEPCTTQ